jgi:hypothetical protein
MRQDNGHKCKADKDLEGAVHAQERTQGPDIYKQWTDTSLITSVPNDGNGERDRVFQTPDTNCMFRKTISENITA